MRNEENERRPEVQENLQSKIKNKVERNKIEESLQETNASDKREQMSGQMRTMKK